MKPLELEEGGLALTYNLDAGNGREVILGKHLGKKSLVYGPQGEPLILGEDLWEVPGINCTISDPVSGFMTVGSFIPARNLMPLGKPTPLKEFKPVSFVVA